MIDKFIRAGLSAPVTITWEVTHHCNLACIHCLSASSTVGGVSDADGELSLDEARQVVDQLAELKVFQVNFGGGEPFLRPDLMTLINYTVQRGITTCVSTNGTVIDEALARRLAQLEPLYLQVSLDGATPEVNDQIRGPGTHRRALRCLELLHKYDIAFSVNTVLTRTNFHQLDQLYDLARAYGGRLRVSRFRPSGRGKESWELLHPTHGQHREFYHWLRQHQGVSTGDSFFFLSALVEKLPGLNVCGAGKLTCCLSPTGDIYPCGFLQADEFRAGSLREAPLATIWADSPVFARFRQLRIDACTLCDRYDLCHGGCVLMAYHVYGTMDRPDPGCVLQWTDFQPPTYRPRRRHGVTATG